MPLRILSSVGTVKYEKNEAEHFISSLSHPHEGEERGLSTSVHINYLDKTKSTPLHLAVRGGNIEVIKLCIIKGARVDQQQVIAVSRGTKCLSLDCNPGSLRRERDAPSKC